MAKNTINHIIFYGTLMGKSGGLRNYSGRDSGGRHEPHSTYLQDITISGRLFNVGGFPALVMGQGTIVQAELYKINDMEIMKRYDGIEGYHGNKEGDMYTRTVVHLDDLNLDAWVYTWNGPTSNLTVIESGNWLER